MWYVPHSRLRLLEIQLRRRFNGVLSSGLFCLGLSSNQLCCYHHRHMSFLRRRRLTKIIPMIHQYLPTKTHIYDSCIPTNYESIARPDQEIKARLALCSQWNNSQCLLPLPCLLAVTDDRIEAGLIKLQPLSLHLIQQLQNHLPLPCLSACITHRSWLN